MFRKMQRHPLAAGILAFLAPFFSVASMFSYLAVALVAYASLPLESGSTAGWLILICFFVLNLFFLLLCVSALRFALPAVRQKPEKKVVVSAVLSILGLLLFTALWIIAVIRFF